MSKSLKEFLEICKEAYYAGCPIISDDQYDNLEEICNEDLSVGTNRGRTRHWYRMYSLQKVYEGDKLPFTRGMVSTAKLDGAAIALRYINGKFVSAVTRGNGEYGEDISHLLEYDWDHTCINIGIDWEIPIDGVVQITGEIVAPKTIKNARNYAAGALNLKSGEEFVNADIKFIAYGIQPYPTGWYFSDMEELRKAGFNTVWREEPFDEYPTDGRVHRLNSNKEFEEAGYTSKHPRGAYALKVRTEGIETKIIGVTWQTGKSGKVTPVAILEPIEIDGATVSRATLNNVGFIEALGVCIGDSVMVERAGGIIPRIIRKAE